MKLRVSARCHSYPWRRRALLLCRLPLIIMFFVHFISAGICDAAIVGEIEIEGLHRIEENELLYMLGIEKGGQIDKKIVSNGIKRAFLKGIFEDISVLVTEGEFPGVDIHVRERDFIDKVRITGDPGLSGKRLKDMFMLKEGRLMRYDLTGRAASDLKEKIIYRGFPDPEVSVTIVRSDEPNLVDVVLKVDAGEPFTVKKVDIQLSPRAEEGMKGDIAGVMKVKAGDIFDQERVGKDLGRIRTFLKKKGYYAPSVGPYSYHEGILEIIVRPGRRMSFSMEGNSAISDKKLLGELPFFEIGDFNDELLDESVGKMISLYHSKGYPFAQIAPVIKSDDRNIDISFFVYEGERIRVRSVRIEGTSLPGERIKEVMSLKEGDVFNPGLMDEDKERLEDFYGALGYLNAEIEEIEENMDRKSQAVDLTVQIDEGEKTVIASVDITGEEPDLEPELLSLAGIRAGDPYNEVDIADARFRILEYYYDRGFANIDVTVLRERQNSSVAVTFEVGEGKKSRFGKTIIVGNRQTKYEVIKRELVHKEGETYSSRALMKDRQKLYRLGLFRDVEIETLDREGNKKDVLVKVEEGNPGAFEFGLGYAEYERFRGFAEVSYRNLWGMNRQGLLRAELSSLERRVILQYNEPWFLGRPLPFKSFFLFEDRREINIDDRSTRYRLERYAITAGVEKELTEKVRADFYYEFSLVRTSDVQPDVILSKEDTGSLAISSVRPALIYDTRDNPFDPHKGILAGVSMKVASLVLLSEADFAKIEIFGNNFHRLSKRFTLALSMRGGVAYNFGDTQELPLVERFFLGGRSTVRGYEQDSLGPKGEDGNPTGGNAFLLGNIELRTAVGRGLSLVPFADMGNVWVKTGELDPADLKYTAGIGLRYKTPVGPLRVDYGFKLNREADESKGELHFSIGHAF
jgi:outer membrane protein insertion porin family